MSEPTSGKPRRRRFGVSLRVMMLLILAVGCWLGWRVRRAETQRRAVAQVEKPTTTIQYDYQFSGGRLKPKGVPRAPAWLRTSIGDEYFQEVTSVTFFSFGNPTRDADLAPLEQFDRLEQVLSDSDRITDAGLAHLEGLTSLREIKLHEAPITDAGLAHLKRLTRLRKLDFNQTSFEVTPFFPSREERALRAELLRKNLTPHEFNRQLWLRRHKHVSDAGLAHLAGLTRMEELILKAPGVTNAGLVHLKEMTRLQKLDLSNTGVSGAGLVHLKGMTGLRELNLASTGLTDAGLAHLSGMTGLRKLDLSNTSVSGAGLAHLKGLDRLEVLRVWIQGHVTDAGLASLKGLKGLRELELWGDNITDGGLANLSGLTKLETLRLPAADVTDAGLVHLKGLTALKTLDLSRTQVTGPGLVHLRGLSALHKLDLQVTTVNDEAVDALREAIPGLIVTHRTPIQIIAEKMKLESQAAAAPR